MKHRRRFGDGKWGGNSHPRHIIMKRLILTRCIVVAELAGELAQSLSCINIHRSLNYSLPVNAMRGSAAWRVAWLIYILNAGNKLISARHS